MGGIWEHRYCKSKADLAWFCAQGNWEKYKVMEKMPKNQLIAIKCRVQRKLKEEGKARFY